MSIQLSWVANKTCVIVIIIIIVFKLKINTGLHHYLYTILRSDERVMATHIILVSKHRMILHLFHEEYHWNVYYVIYIMWVIL